jgi:uncharacterized protein GlcG (DUF336 family)
VTATRQARKLTHAAVLQLLQAAEAEASRMGVPQCIAIADEGTNLLGFLRMDGAKVLSIASAQAKAVTAASTGKPTGGLAPESETRLALATGMRTTNLKGGLPILVEGELVGGIGVGSGTGEQDRQVAAVALASLGLPDFRE